MLKYLPLSAYTIKFQSKNTVTTTINSNTFNYMRKLEKHFTGWEYTQSQDQLLNYVCTKSTKCIYVLDTSSYIKLGTYSTRLKLHTNTNNTYFYLSMNFYIKIRWYGQAPNARMGCIFTTKQNIHQNA